MFDTWSNIWAWTLSPLFWTEFLLVRAICLGHYVASREGGGVAVSRRLIIHEGTRKDTLLNIRAPKKGLKRARRQTRTSHVTFWWALTSPVAWVTMPRADMWWMHGPIHKPQTWFMGTRTPTRKIPAGTVRIMARTYLNKKHSRQNVQRKKKPFGRRGRTSSPPSGESR